MLNNSIGREQTPYISLDYCIEKYCEEKETSRTVLNLLIDFFGKNTDIKTITFKESQSFIDYYLTHPFSYNVLEKLSFNEVSLLDGDIIQYQTKSTKKQELIYNCIYIFKNFWDSIDYLENPWILAQNESWRDSIDEELTDDGYVIQFGHKKGLILPRAESPRPIFTVDEALKKYKNGEPLIKIKQLTYVSINDYVDFLNTIKSDWFKAAAAASLYGGMSIEDIIVSKKSDFLFNLTIEQFYEINNKYIKENIKYQYNGDIFYIGVCDREINCRKPTTHKIRKQLLSLPSDLIDILKSQFESTKEIEFAFTYNGKPLTEKIIEKEFQNTIRDTPFEVLHSFPSLLHSFINNFTKLFVGIHINESVACQIDKYLDYTEYDRPCNSINNHNHKWAYCLDNTSETFKQQQLFTGIAKW